MEDIKKEIYRFFEEKGKAASVLFESTIDFKVDAHIPSYYITSSAARMDIYKKISHIRTPKDRDEVFDELTDRFGDVPKPVSRLITVALCRAIAELAKIPRIEHKGMSILFYMDKPDLSVWSMVLASHKGKLIGAGGAAPIIYRLKQGDDPLGALLSVLTDYYNELNS